MSSSVQNEGSGGRPSWLYRLPWPPRAASARPGLKAMFVLFWVSTFVYRRPALEHTQYFIGSIVVNGVNNALLDKGFKL